MKLKHYNIHGNAYNWLKSYLSNRKQQVFLNGTFSEQAFITVGVPQGSLLGPVLFLIYINDFENCSDKFNFTLYADDTTLTYQFPPQENPSSIINNELQKVSMWLKVNKLSINVSKTQGIIFGEKYSPEKYDILFDNTKIEMVNNIKFLGIIFDSELSWKGHVDMIRVKVRQSAGCLGRCKNLLDLKSKRMIYFAIIHSHLMYGVELWGSANITIIKPLEILQKRAIRAVSGKPPRHPTSELFKQLGILKLADLCNSQLIKLSYKGLQNSLPENIQRYFIKRSANRTGVDTRQTDNTFYLSRKGTRVQNNRPSVKGTHLWNSLPINLRSAPSLNTLAKNYKTYLLQNY